MGRTKRLRAGDRVEWNSRGGRSANRGKGVGRVLRKITAPMRIKGHQVRASKDDPQYLVESERSGGVAAHRPTALRRRKKG
jgi:hypothetical protein